MATLMSFYSKYYYVFLFLRLSFLGVLIRVSWNVIKINKIKKNKGLVLEGTEEVKSRNFNNILKGEGIGIPLKNNIVNKHDFLRVKKEDEEGHFLIMGDTGTGKSAIKHWLLLQLIQRQETVIIYDPALEFWKAHGMKSDILLHPVYEKCPFWCIGSEIKSPLHAEALARSFIPDIKHGQYDFWTDSAQQVLSFLLASLEEKGESFITLLKWLDRPEIVTNMVQNTRYQSYLPLDAPKQRQGVMASLNRVAKALNYLPELDDNEVFSFRHWAKNRNRWIFIGTDVPGAREPLRPVISAWLDTALRSLMENKQKKPVWIFLDELPTLQKLPSLQEAFFEGRKYGLRLVVGMQGAGQIKELYGNMAETMLSCSRVKLFLRTSEYSSAKAIAETIGLPRKARERKSYHRKLFNIIPSVSWQTEIHRDFVICPNVIQNLETMEGIIKYGSSAVPFNFSYPPIQECNYFAKRKLERRY